MKMLRSEPNCWAGFLLLACSLLRSLLLAADAEICAVCGRPLIESYYSIEDKVTLERRHVCKDCEKSYPDCFVCGLPAKTNLAGFVELPDQRVLCARDARTAVLREEEGLRICRDVRDSLDRLLSRFTSFPETNVTAALVDRVHLVALFRLAGNDYRCPNVWGITETTTNHDFLEYHISLMSGLPLSWFQATCAHEYTHTWVAEHLTRARKDSLSRDAEEGFCELIAFLFMESINDQAQKALILRNAYTRGQLDLFVAAEREYGLNEVLDWMQYGTDDRLSATEPGRVRKISIHPSASAETQFLLTATPLPVPNALVLKAIFWDPKRPTALINDHTFAPNEEAKVRTGATNALVRVLAISSDSVHVRVSGSEHEQVLQLKSK
jgi:hypothetical protein